MTIFGILLVTVSFVLVGLAAYKLGASHGWAKSKESSIESVRDTFNAWSEAMNEAGVSDETKVKINTILTRRAINELNSLYDTNGQHDDKSANAEEIRH